MNNSAETFINDVNGLASSIIMDDNLWKLFGYKKRPKRGAFFNKFINDKRLKTEMFLLREMYIICIANAISFLNNELDTKKIFVKRILDQYFSFAGIIEAFHFASEFESFNYFYKSIWDYLKANKEQYTEIFINRSQNILGNLFSSAWIVSFIQLNSVSGSIMSSLLNYLNSNHDCVLINDVVFTSEYVSSY